MSTATLAIDPMTTAAQEGCALPNGHDEDALYEIVHGQRVELPSMGIRSTWLGTRLTKLLSIHVDERLLGTVVSEGLFILDEEEAQQRRPDLAFVSAATWPLEREIPLIGDWKVVPELAVEIVSPNDLFEKLLEKIEEYFARGVKQVWVVSPTVEKVYVYDDPVKVRVLALKDELDGGALLPGFHLKVADLFRRAAVKE